MTAWPFCRTSGRFLLPHIQGELTMATSSGGEERYYLLDKEAWERLSEWLESLHESHVHHAKKT